MFRSCRVRPDTGGSCWCCPAGTPMRLSARLAAVPVSFRPPHYGSSAATGRPAGCRIHPIRYGRLHDRLDGPFRGPQVFRTGRASRRRIRTARPIRSRNRTAPAMRPRSAHRYECRSAFRTGRKTPPRTADCALRFPLSYPFWFSGPIAVSVTATAALRSPFCSFPTESITATARLQTYAVEQSNNRHHLRSHCLPSD